MKLKIGRRKKDDDGRYRMELDDKSCPAEFGTETVRVGLKKYEIPVDSDGLVPTWAIVSRFHELCDWQQRRDDINELDSDDEPVLPPRLTPREIAQWWADPSSMDIQGIDTADSEFYDVSCIDDPLMADLQSRIAIISDSRDESYRIRQAIADHFDYAELDEMTEDRSIIIQTVPDGGEAYGIFMKRQKGLPTPIIIYEAGASVDTIVHEMVHFLRTMKSRRGGPASTAFPMDDDGELDLDAIDRMGQDDYERMMAIEETETVKETIVRRDKNTKPSGYYDDVHNGKLPQQNLKEDVRILKGQDLNRRIRGKQAVKRVALEQDRTNIAMAEIKSREPAKLSKKKLYSGKGES